MGYPALRVGSWVQLSFVTFRIDILCRRNDAELTKHALLGVPEQQIVVAAGHPDLRLRIDEIANDPRHVGIARIDLVDDGLIDDDDSWHGHALTELRQETGG